MCVALFTLNMPHTHRKSLVIFSHLWKSFLVFFLFFFFFFQSVNKVTIAARAKTVGKIVFIDKWKYFLYYIFAYLFSVNRVTEIDSDSDEERKVPAFHSPAIIEFTSSSDIDEDTEIFASLSQRQKKVSKVLWMDEPVQTVNSIPYNIDGICVQNKSKKYGFTARSAQRRKKMKQRFNNTMDRVCFCEIPSLLRRLHMP